jgi:RNA polymerase sigma factor (sigma-70 family)
MKNPRISFSPVLKIFQEIAAISKIFQLLSRLHPKMNEVPSTWTIIEQDHLLSQAMERDEPRLRNFIRKHVADTGEAEDILQDVFYELLEAYRLMKPVEHVTAWLFRVARNRMVDLFRKKRPSSLNSPASKEEDGGTLEDLLPSADAGPEAAYARSLLLDALDDALEELPEGQRNVFIAHELMGQSFKEISAESGLSVNTLLSRKRYAVLHLRESLQSIYQSFVKK